MKRIETLMVIVAVLVLIVSAQAVSYEEYNLFNSGGLTSLDIGDLNRDGSADIVFGMTDGRVWRNVQTGARGAFSSNLVDSYGQAVMVKAADVNGDGFNDIVVGRHLNGDLHKELSTGPDSFAYGLVNSYGAYAGPVTGDLNQDGLTDIAMQRHSDGLIMKEVQDGSGGLTYGTNGTFGLSDHRIAVGHLDATTSSLVNDMVVTRWNGSDYADVRVQFQTGVGAFTDSGAIATYGNMITGLAIGDLDADGDQDILTVLDDGRLFSSAQTGSHTFSTSNILNYGQELTAVEIGDVDNDGRDDVIAALADGRLFVELQETAGSFTGQLISTFSGTTVNDIAVGDLDSDGLNDFAVSLVDGRAYGYYQVPEPATIGLLAVGAIGMIRRRKNK